MGRQLKELINLRWIFVEISFNNRLCLFSQWLLFRDDRVSRIQKFIINRNWDHFRCFLLVIICLYQSISTSLRLIHLHFRIMLLNFRFGCLNLAPDGPLFGRSKVVRVNICFFYILDGLWRRLVDSILLPVYDNPLWVGIVIQKPSLI